MIDKLASSSFKVRTITAFVSLSGLPINAWDSKIETVATFLNDAKAAVERLGVEVQTLRIATDFMSSSEWNHITDVQHLESIITSKGLTFLNAGLAFSSETLQAIPQLIQQTTCTSVSYNMSDAFDLKEALDVAEVVLKVSKLTDGKGNFRFCAAAHTDGYAIPFFPAASACAATSGSFAIGLENGRLLQKALLQCVGRPNDIEYILREEVEGALRPIVAVMREMEASSGLRFAGVDTSIAPGLDDPSIADSFAAVLGHPYKFGQAGTLSLCGRITRALKTCNIGCPIIGYSGIMLPVQEDPGLALHADQGHYTVTELLASSAVCGVGIDTLPCPGPSDDEKANEELRHAIARTLMDVATLAHRLQKPLSCRLLPVPHKKTGERTEFNNPYLIEANIMRLL